MKILDRKRTDCSALPKGWQREEQIRKSGLSAGKVDVYYYSPSGHRIDSKSKLIRHLGGTMDLSTFDYQLGRHAQASLIFHHPSPSPSTTLQSSTNAPSTLRLAQAAAGSKRSSDIAQIAPPSPLIKQQFEYRNARTDAALVPPIRQTASIFKQPVTVYKIQDSVVKQDLKHGVGKEKPKQLFWEKRLEGMRACDYDGSEFSPVVLPKCLRPVGPNLEDETLLRSVATALHVSSTPVTGQTTSKSVLTENPGIFLNADQPLMLSTEVNEDDIRRQEERVGNARKKLQEFLKG